jgi:hypothetical protein
MCTLYCTRTFNIPLGTLFCYHLVLRWAYHILYGLRGYLFYWLVLFVSSMPLVLPYLSVLVDIYYLLVYIFLLINYHILLYIVFINIVYLLPYLLFNVSSLHWSILYYNLLFTYRLPLF